MNHTLKNKYNFTNNIAVIILFLTFLFPWGLLFSNRVSLLNSLALPSFSHLLGTDILGRDLLVIISNAVKYTVIPIWIGVCLSSALGAGAAFCSILMGSQKKFLPFLFVIQAIFVVIISIPIGIVVFYWSAVIEKAGLMAILISLSVLFFIRVYQKIIDLYKTDKNLLYWQSHKAVGGSLAQRLWKYGYTGKWRDILFLDLAFNLKTAVAIEASLSYLGFGVQVPKSSFGNILVSHFDLYLKGHWHTVIIVIFAFAVTAYFPSSLIRLFAQKAK